ncbi:unnamed protein product [Parascedosporium putredinis]|uniref:Succinate/fumarate mitochondrial transporter n=1 Tax=Parascedosporium putredinis TaxID=1442378 RepID=A0A9P1H9L7_9PEZI|nr:unnamed protein product [Parascedosporium putredinis]CAI8000998.1 unnamed protein product [Parascedosporium putredinis]
MASKSANNGKTPPSAATNLVAGGGAGMMEALVCHPLDTIKVRMQLSKRARAPGLGAVLTGIVPKMAIRFTSFEAYKQFLADKETGRVSGKATFFAGLAAGVTEAVAVVTPMEVIKIRLQAQNHSMSDPLDVPKYRNAAHALYTVVKEEGFGALYRGVSLTALRQGSNQAVNFTAYSYFKDYLYKWQPEYVGQNLPGWQTTLIGLVSGAMGPLSNAPIDTIKTRLQRKAAQPGVSAWQRITAISAEMFKQEGFHAFYKGITPELCVSLPARPSLSPCMST